MVFPSQRGLMSAAVREMRSWWLIAGAPSACPRYPSRNAPLDEDVDDADTRRIAKELENSEVQRACPGDGVSAGFSSFSYLLHG